MNGNRKSDEKAIELSCLNDTLRFGAAIAEVVVAGGKAVGVGGPSVSASGQSIGAGAENKSATIIALSGNLGAGKTTLVQSIGKTLGVREVINSPTFTMMNEYHSGRLPLYHFDFYRVSDSLSRADDLDEEVSLDLLAAEFDEICQSQALIVIEWPEYFIVSGTNYLEPLDRLEVRLDLSADQGDHDDERIAIVSATGTASASLLSEFLRIAG